MKFLCDTNIISEAMRRVPLLHLREWVDKQNPVIISAVTVEEIYFGLTCKTMPDKSAWFDDFLRLRAQVLPITVEIAQQCGIWRGQFRKRGITRTQADLLIAATAHVHNLILATRNTRDFTDCGIQLFNPFLDNV